MQTIIWKQRNRNRE